MDIKALAEQNDSYIIERRRYYHAHPELSFQEWETTKSLIEDVKALGYEVQDFMPEYPGIIATLDTGKPGRTIMLRSDIDALPITEKTGFEFASQNEGVMHACGHDTHMAMLLGAAKIIAENKDELKCGKVKLIFQSGEEYGYGAKYYIDHGCLDDVDAIFGMHVWGTLESPYISIDPGKRMASMDNFTIKIKGKASHGSAPQDGHDAIVAASAVVMALQSYVSRVNNPINPLVVSIGKFHGGNIYNIICPEVEMSGTIRTYSRELRSKLEDDFHKIVDNTAAAYGCTAEIEMSHVVPAVINETAELNEIARNAALKLYGEAGIKEMPSLMGSEDFAMLMEKVPGFFAFIGSKNVETGNIYTNHNEKYSCDEAIIHRGAAFAAQFAFDYLAK